MKLSAEKIQSNWVEFNTNIEQHITGDRKQKLLDFYKKYEERVSLMPASHKKEYHSAFPGGYVDHVNRVVKAALSMSAVWLFLLQQHDIKYTFNEMIAIQTHDGLYDPANEKYLKSFMPETKPRTSLPFILHQADMMAARIEFEIEWLPKFKNNLGGLKSNFTLGTNSGKSNIKNNRQ